MKAKGKRQKVKVSLIILQIQLLLIIGSFFVTKIAAQSNDLQNIPDGGFIGKWLISNPFPAEIDAGAWENFNRFNIENLPQKDWLKPFGKPQSGKQSAVADGSGSSENPKSQIPNPKSNDPLPEIGAATNSGKQFPDAKEVFWTEFVEKDAVIAFNLFHEGKPIGTSYAASYINSANDDLKFIETDGFLGAIWLNGEKIYDGYSLTLTKVAVAKFKKGENFLLIRATGISGDYWRKDGGWTASIRLWKNEIDAKNSAEFKPNGANGTIFYLEGFHVDPVYLHDQKGYARITLSNTAQYLRNLRSDKNYGVYLSEIDYLKPYLDTHPEDRDFLREAVKAGRVGTGGAYNQFNENTIGGEAIIRNILYGQSMHQAMLGRKSESLAVWDVFGHAPQISQIAAKSGFTGITWSKKITGFQPFFYDYALDGSRLLHRRVDYAYSFSGFGSGKNYSLDNFRKMTERKFEETQSFNSDSDLRINAADFTPPWTNLAGNVEKLENSKPKIQVTGQAQDLYFQSLNKEISEGKVKPPITSRDKLFFHVGVSMARSDLKIGQRVSENMTLTAEKFGSIAYMLGAKYPDLALDKAWRQILFGSHHDAITGTPSDNALLDLVQGYREAYEISNDALNDSLNFIAKQVNTNSKFKTQNSNLIPILIFNPMNRTRSDNVKVKVEFPESVKDYSVVDEFGKKVEFRTFKGSFELPQNKMTFVNGKMAENKNAKDGGTKTSEFEFVAKNIPSIGYKTYFIVPTKINNEEKNIRNTFTAIENEFYKITVDATKGGGITSIFDKQANKEIIDISKNHFGNEIGSLKEELTKKNVIYPAWELWTTGEKKFSTEKPATVISYQRGETQTLAITGELPNMEKFNQVIELHKGVKRIDFKTELIDYKGKDELFVVNFPLNLTGGALVTEDRFGTVVRNNSKGFLDFRTNTDKLVSGSPVYSVNNWAEYGSVLNLNFIRGGNLRVSKGANAGISSNIGEEIAASVPFKPTALVRPHGESFEKNTEIVVSNLIKRGVSVTPFYDDNDESRRKKLTIEDSTMPRNLNDDIAYHGFRISLGGEKENLYSAKLLTQVSTENRARFEERLSKNGFAYLFLYDKNVPAGWSPMPVLLIAGDVGKAVENLVLPISKGEFALNIPFESFAVETNPNKDLPRVPDYGVALINNGTAGVSLENPNTLTLFLTHTALFPGVNLPFEFTPENKTHIFNYSLYPHAKDWREADTVKVGYDANNPLIAVQTDVHDGNLPGEKSFFEITNPKLVLSALKLGENPQANFLSVKDENQRPLIFRYYESEGKKHNSQINTGFDISTFSPVDLLENKTKIPEVALHTSRNFGINADAFGIETVQLKPRKILNASQDNNLAKETIQPIFSRYWLHNTGVAPIGNDAVKVSLRPVEQMGELSNFGYDDKYNQGGTTTIAVRVQVVNNYQDRKISGEVKLEVPDDWRVVPATVKYEIEPNGSVTQDIAIIAFPVKKDLEWQRASGLIKAKIEHNGQTFQDVLTIGKPQNLEWAIEQTPTETIVKIKNPNRQTIEGAVDLITPPEAWFFNAPTFSRAQGFAIEPNSEIILKFETGNLPAGTWRIAKISYNGIVEYKRKK